MRLYLRQLRQEFQVAARAARDAAAHSDTPAAGIKVLRLTAEFYTLQVLLYAQIFLGRRVVSTEPLLRRILPLLRLS